MEPPIMSERDSYTLKEISVAFGKTFHRSGEAFFDYMGTDKECEESTKWYWEEFVENLETVRPQDES